MTQPLRRVGLLGGTLDPIHCGHLDAATASQAALRLDRIVVVPSHVPPHRPPPFASSYHRFAMVALAIAGRPDWQVSDLELLEAARSYTADTLRAYHADGFNATELFFITGADAFVDIATWKDYPALLDLAHFVVVSRPGTPVGEVPGRLPALAPRMNPPSDVSRRAAPTIFLIDAPTADVSSTAIRHACERGASIAGMVPDAVRQHIEQHGLYRGADPRTGTGTEPAGDTAGRLHGQD
jgi:nicotinate-nucleotide adenylyltransferase